MKKEKTCWECAHTHICDLYGDITFVAKIQKMIPTDKTVGSINNFMASNCMYYEYKLWDNESMKKLCKN